MTDRNAVNDLIPVILSGGAGTRLWPISRESSPKPFIKLPDGQSLIEKTYERALSPLGVAEVLTVTNRDYYFRCKDEYQLAGEAASSGVPAGFLLEPTTSSPTWLASARTWPRPRPWRTQGGW